MGLTITGLRFDLTGSGNQVKGTIAFDSSYPTGGESLLPSQIGLAVIDSIDIDAKGGYSFSYDYTNQKLLAYLTPGFTPGGSNSAPAFTGSALGTHTHALHLNNADVADGASTTVNAATNLLGANTGTDIEVAGVADTSGVGGIVAIGAGTPAGTVAAPTFTGNAVSAAALAEVANATNLSALTGVRFRAEGA